MSPRSHREDYKTDVLGRASYWDNLTLFNMASNARLDVFGAHCYKCDKTKSAALEMSDTSMENIREISVYLVKIPQLTAYRVRVVTMESDLDRIISRRYIMIGS
jgi:hypothetical protein